MISHGHKEARETVTQNKCKSMWTLECSSFIERSSIDCQVMLLNMLNSSRASEKNKIIVVTKTVEKVKYY